MIREGRSSESLLTISPECMKIKLLLNRTKGFVNLNRFKSGRAIKRLGKTSYNELKKTREKRGEDKNKRE